MLLYSSGPRILLPAFGDSRRRPNLPLMRGARVDPGAPVATESRDTMTAVNVNVDARPVPGSPGPTASLPRGTATRSRVAETEITERLAEAENMRGSALVSVHPLVAMTEGGPDLRILLEVAPLPLLHT